MDKIPGMLDKLKTDTLLIQKKTFCVSVCVCVSLSVMKLKDKRLEQTIVKQTTLVQTALAFKC